MQIETTVKVIFGRDEDEEAEKFRATHTPREGWIMKSGNYSTVFTKTERNEANLRPQI